MAECDLDSLILIVVGTTLRAEEKDRPLAQQLAAEIQKRLTADSAWTCLVVSDLFYINNAELHQRPTISLGGPGVNLLSGMYFRELPAALAVDHVLLIQMDVTMQDMRAAIWGMNHETTVEALRTFIEKGHLDRYVAGALAKE